MGCLLLVASSLVAACIGELGVRAFGHRPLLVMDDRTVFWHFDPLLGWHHRPGQQGLFVRAGDRVEVRINDRGLRDHDYAYQRSAGKQRILVLGDSFAWGYGVAQDEIFTERIEATLDDVEVINAGVSGYSTDQELLWLKHEGVKYRPDLVILLLVGNDDAMNHQRVSYFVYPKPLFKLGEAGDLELHNVPVPRASLARRLAYQGCRRSALINLFVGRATRVIRGGWKPASSEPRASRPVAEAGVNQSAPFALTSALIHEIRGESAAVGAELLIVATSMYWQADSAGTYEELLEVLRSQEHDVLDVEATEGFDADSMRLSGDGHWNAEGHAFVAMRVLERLDGYGMSRAGS